MIPTINLINKPFTQSVSVQISGRNFEGSMQIKGDSLSLDLKQFKKRAFYTFEITSTLLQKDPKKFLLFKKVKYLFNELNVNKNLLISDENTLLVPFEVTYQNRQFQLRVQLPLKQRRLGNEQKVQSLFEQIQRLNQEKKLLIPQMFQFKVDEKNVNLKQFEFSNNQKTIKKIGGNNQNHILNHFEPLNIKGIFYFKVKMAKGLTSYGIGGPYLGICSNLQKLQERIDTNHYFMGLGISCNKLLSSGKQFDVLNVNSQGQFNYKIQIDMNRKWVSWFCNNHLLHSTQITKYLADKPIYPMICMQMTGEIAEIIDK